MAALLRLEHARGAEEVLGAFDALARWLPGPEHEGLRRAFWEWARQVYGPVPGRGVGPAVPEESMTEGEMRRLLSESVKEWAARAQEKGRAEGRIEGLTEGQAKVMRRMAARKFGVGTAERLVERLEGLGDSERMADIGDWLIECESGEELLGRVEHLCASSPGGGRFSSVGDTGTRPSSGNAEQGE